MGLEREDMAARLDGEVVDVELHNIDNRKSVPEAYD
jgi:DNA polymerase II large subunit